MNSGWIRRHPRMVDGVVAAALFTVTIWPGIARGRLGESAVFVAAASFGVLVLRRRWPIPAFVATVIGAETFLTMTERGMAVLAAPMIALYTVAEANNRRTSLIAGAIAAVAMATVHGIGGGERWGGSENLALVALCGLAIFAGDAARVRRAYIAEVEERARQVEHHRRQEAERRITEERLRLARELHDVLGHQIALINVQAGVASDALDGRHDQARQALAHVRQAGREALNELRDTVGLLREPGTPAEPVKGLADLEELLGSFRASGLRVEHRVAGNVRRLPATVDLTAYRVIQESLTNVRKHTDARTAVVRLDYRPVALHVSIQDDGSRQPEGTATGNGIPGMRERVTAIGGTLRVGPRRAAGFRVSARLPLGDHA